MANTVKFFQNTQSGAPTLAGQANSLIAVLNACLVNGFNLKSITGITRTGETATATANGHGYRDGDILLFSGADQEAYNGEQRVRNVTTNTFDFSVTGDPITPATGTITAKIAPLGWESPFTGANKAAYRATDPASNRLFLRIDESPMEGDLNYGRGLRSVVAQMWEVLTDIDNGTGKAETFWRKAQNESVDARPWVLVGDGKRFWLAVAWSETYPNRYVPYFFGDFPSYKAGDAYGALIAGYYDLSYNYSDPSTNEVIDTVLAIGTAVGNNGIWVARNHSQLGGRINVLWVSGPGYNGGSGTMMGSTGIPYPNPADNGIYVMPLIIQEQTGPSLRGRLPGLLCPLHAIAAPEPWKYPGFVVDGTTHEILVLTGAQGNGATRIAFDLTGPWD